METKANRSPPTLFWIAGIAVTVFSVAGIAAIMGWIPTSTGGPGDSVVAAKQPATQPAASSDTAPSRASSVPLDQRPTRQSALTAANRSFHFAI